MDQIPHFKKLLNESNSFWREFIDNYLIKSPQITVIIEGHPHSLKYVFYVCHPSLSLSVHFTLYSSIRF